MIFSRETEEYLKSLPIKRSPLLTKALAEISEAFSDQRQRADGGVDVVVSEKKDETRD
jgi:hypothetical protein